MHNQLLDNFNETYNCSTLDTNCFRKSLAQKWLYPKYPGYDNNDEENDVNEKNPKAKPLDN